MSTRWAALVMGVALSLAACGGADEDASSTAGKRATPNSDASSETTGDRQDGHQDRGRITVGDRVFTFNPSTCWVDADDTEVNGPGREEGGDVVYVDFQGGGSDFEIRIELGTDSPFDSTDEQIMADRYVTEPLSVAIDGLDVTATGVFLDEHGQIHDGDVVFTCR